MSFRIKVICRPTPFSNTQRALTEMGFTQATEIQAKSIPALLAGKDVPGAAKTGSGKTCFLDPAVELLCALALKRVMALELLSSRLLARLALQIYGVARDLFRYHNQTHGIVMGGCQPQD